MKLRVAMLGGAFVLGVVVTLMVTMWINHHTPAASKASPPPIGTLDKIPSAPQGAPNPKLPPKDLLPKVRAGGGFPFGSDPLAWTRKLSENKKQQVDNAFAEHAACLKERMSSANKGEQDKPIDIETMRGIMEDCNDGLKATLRTVLSDEEYKGFLDSLPPTPPAPPEVPAVPNPSK